MTPIRFAQANIELKAPAGQEESVEPLWVFRGNDASGMPVVISAWRPTPEELVKINMGEPVFLTIIGQTMPPALVTANYPWQEEAEKAGR